MLLINGLVRITFSNEVKTKFINDVKEKIFNNLKYTQVEPVYYEFLEKLGQKLALEQLTVISEEPIAVRG